MQNTEKTKQNPSHPPASDPEGRTDWRRIVMTIAVRVTDHNVFRNAAGLAYYLLFALFPLLIFISNLLGLLHLDMTYITKALSAVLPKDIIELFGTYLQYVSQTSSPVLMGFSLVCTIWFPMRAANGLMNDVRCAYQLSKPKKPLVFRVKQLLFTIVLLFVIALTLALSIVGQKIIDLLLGWIPSAYQVGITSFLLEAWGYLRFILAGILMVVMLGVLYTIPHDSRIPVRKILPGTLAALIGWLTVSVIFSFYVNNFSNYTVIYGTLGTMIALLSWLYMTSLILILGAEVNAALEPIEPPHDAHAEESL